ncbi:hypothetical protein [Bacillus sp. GB_SG_008]|uniref:hypothetical protein n=1 Tax=Bacillus sp. GB_SG_008 TaxID=3454627 RepID=UPI003F860E3E
MTLSQGIIKKWLLPFILCFSMIFAFFPQSKVDAATRTYDYTITSGRTAVSKTCQTSYDVINHKVNVTNVGGGIFAYEQIWSDKEGRWVTMKYRWLTYFSTPVIFKSGTEDGDKWRIYMKAVDTSHVHVDCYGSSSF